MPGKGSNIALAVLAAGILAAGITGLIFFLRQKPEPIGTAGGCIADGSDGRQPAPIAPDPADPGEEKTGVPGARGILVLLDTGGAPMPGAARIEILAGDTSVYSSMLAVTDSGKIEIPVGPTTGDLVVRAEGYFDSARKMAGEREMKVKIAPRPGSVRVEIFGRKGAKVSSCQAFLTARGPAAASVALEESAGGFTAEIVPPGEYSVGLLTLDSEQVRLEKSILVRPGARVYESIEAPLDSASLLLVGDSGEPLPLSRLKLYMAGEKFKSIGPFMETEAASNPVIVEGLSARNHEIVIAADSMAWAFVRTKPGLPETRVTLRPARGIEIELDPGKAGIPPLVRIQVRDRQYSGMHMPVAVRQDGTCTLMLADGNYSVRFFADGFEDAELNINIDDFTRGRVKLGLNPLG